jgi:hypothetical protein
MNSDAVQIRLRTGYVISSNPTQAWAGENASRTKKYSRIAAEMPCKNPNRKQVFIVQHGFYLHGLNE